MKFSIEQFVERVIIIDDTESDSEKLREQLESFEISCDIYTPETIKGKSFRKNRQLIFCDLRLNEHAQDSTGAASVVRKTLSSLITDEFGAYGLILWTEHEEDVEDVKAKLSLDRKNKIYNTPIFVTSLSKLIYKQANDYSTIITDLNNRIKGDIAAYFYLTWGASVKCGFNKTTLDMYSFVDGYQEQSERMRSSLLLLAQNFTGLPDRDLSSYEYLSDDAYKAVNDILCSDLYNATSNGNDLFQGNVDKSEVSLESELKAFSFINTKLFICTDALDQTQIHPGNVYGADNLDTSLKIQDSPKKSSAIVIELTPPCDYSHKKVMSRLVVGFMVECPWENDKVFDLVKIGLPESRYTVWPISVNGKLIFLCFDFRHLVNIGSSDLIDNTKYPLLFRLNHNLFADVIQKFSSHAARIGENMLRPRIVNPMSLIETIDEQKVVQKIKEKLRKGPFPIKEYKSIVSGRFNLSNDADYLAKLLDRNNIRIDGDYVKNKD